MSKSQGMGHKRNGVTSNMNPKICILSVTDLSIDGRTLRQIKTLSERGWEVTIIYHQKRWISRICCNHNVNVVEIKVVSRCLPKRSIFHLVMYLEFCLKAIYIAIRAKADIYQGNNMDGLLPAFVAAILRKSRLVYDTREIFTDMKSVKPKFLWKMLEASLSKRTDAILNVNRERAQLQQQQYGLGEEPTIVMNCPEICPHEQLDKSALRKRLDALGLGKKNVVIYQGAIMRGRYLDNLIRAMKHVRSDALLVLMGYDLRYRDKLNAIAINNGITGKVLFLDPIPPSELVSFASGADLGVLLYENESLNNYYCAPTKLYEYLMAGLPILVNDMPPLKAIVNEENIGKIVDAGVPMSIAQGIDDILENKKEIDAMSKRARGIACDRYNWDTQAKIYLNTIQGMINPCLRQFQLNN